MKTTHIFRVDSELKDPLTALLMEAGLELYEMNDEIIVLKNNEALPEQFNGARKLIKPTNAMGLWAMRIVASKIKK